MEEPKLIPSSMRHIRFQCLELAVSVFKGETVFGREDFGICGVQDLKCQITDFAAALSDYVFEGKMPESMVGKTPLLLSATRLLRDRNIPLPIKSFNEYLLKVGILEDAKLDETRSFKRLTDKGQEYGVNKVKPFGCDGETSPYYYDDKFDKLLTLIKPDTPKPKKRK